MAACHRISPTGSSAEIEEERRLLYVAMTRAKDHLHVVVPQRFFVHGQRSNGDRHCMRRARGLFRLLCSTGSRCRAWPRAAAQAAGGQNRRALRSTSAQRVRRSWG